MEPENPNRKRPKKRFPPQVWAAVQADVEAGMTFTLAAAKWGIPLPTLGCRARSGGWRRCDIDARKAELLLAANAALPAPASTDAAPDWTRPGPGLDFLLNRAEHAVADALDRGCGRDARDFAASYQSLFAVRRHREREPGADDPASELDAASAPPWLTQAHEAQKPPPGEWSTWVFMGGRGAGKMRAGAEWLDALAQADGAARLALVAPTLADVREVMVDGPSGLLNLPRPGRPRWEAARRRLRWDSGAVAYGFSAEERERLRGPQFTGAWADEFCVWRGAGDTLPSCGWGCGWGRPLGWW